MTLRNLIMGSSGDSLWYQQAKFQGTGTVSGDSFGRTGLAISADGLTCIVSSRLDDNSGGTDAGSAYVFTRSGSVWTQQARLQASDAAASDGFGWSVAISSDGNTAAVGAFLDSNSGGTNAGSAYVFTRSGSVWTQQARLQASDAAASDLFGDSISISSDGNTLAVGSRYDDTAAGVDTGSAYIFTRSGSVWTQQAKLVSADTAENNIVYSVTLSADGNTCGFVCPNNSHSSLSNAGAAYIFTRSGSVWTQQAKLIALDPVSTHAWNSFALSGNGNTAAVGATFDSTKAFAGGAIYVFTRSGSVWTQQAKLFTSDTESTDQVGSELSLSNDGNTLAAGVYYKDSPLGEDVGAVYMFSRNGSSWYQQSKFGANDPSVGGMFGESVSLSSDGKSCLIGTSTTFAYYFVR